MQVGAVFGLIFALIVMGFVLFFGADQIANLLCMGGTGQTSKAVKDLEIMVDDIQASGEGSSDVFSMNIAKNAKVCFVDPLDTTPHPSEGWAPDLDLYPVIKIEIETGGYNVWIEYNCGSPNPGYRMDHIVSGIGNFCVNAGDTLLLTNIGTQVRLERLPS